MQSIVLESVCEYDGSALRPRYIYETTGVHGDAILSFVGPCVVDARHMVDLEDLRAKAWIRSDSMLHFIVELFDVSLLAAVGLQRLFIDHARMGFESLGVASVVRHGDDLYDGLYKLSVSIAAPSVTSCLIHVGINISSAGTPIPTRGLADYKIDPAVFSTALCDGFIREYESMKKACVKVKGI